MERDWFLERLQLVADDILTIAEREEKDKRKLATSEPLSLTSDDIAAANHMSEVLSQGIQVRKNNYSCSK